MKTFVTLITLALITLNCVAVEAVDTLATGTAAQVKISSEKDIKESVGCTIERYTIYSPSMKRDIRIAVVLPPQYKSEPNKKFPIIYTLHGYGAPYDTYANMSRFHKAINDMPMIYTCFDGDTSNYLNAPEKPQFQYQTFFFDEFIPFLDANYRTNGQRGVTGFSMGGSGTTLYTLMHPEMFVASCGLSSAYLTFDNLEKRHVDRYAEMLGKMDEYPERYEAVDVYKMIKKHVANGVKLPALRYCCGTEDFLRDDNRKFRDLLVELNAQITNKVKTELTVGGKAPDRRELAKALSGKLIDFKYVEQPGGHNWTYWHGQAPDFARFFWLEFQKDAAK